MSKLSILVVEDEAIVAEDIACKVRLMGYDVAGTAITGEEAVELAHLRRPELVLMDIRLAGDMDGITAAREIRRECKLPVLFLTAHSDPGTVELAQQTGAYGYLLKPFSERDLRIQIEMTLFKHAAEQRLRESEGRLAGINRILQAALTCETEEELGLACLNVAGDVTQSPYGFIGEIKEAGLQNIAVSNPGWEACGSLVFGGHSAPHRGFRNRGIFGRVILSGKSLFTNDPANHPDRVGLPENHPPLASFLGAPLLKEGRVIGMLAVCNREGGYTPTEQEALDALTPSIVEAFSHIRTEAALQKSASELQAANKKLLDSRRATINMMKDALLACRQAEEATLELQREIAERKQIEAALQALNSASIAGEINTPLPGFLSSLWRLFAKH